VQQTKAAIDVWLSNTNISTITYHHHRESINSMRGQPCEKKKRGAWGFGIRNVFAEGKRGDEGGGKEGGNTRDS